MPQCIRLIDGFITRVAYMIPASKPRTRTFMLLFIYQHTHCYLLALADVPQVMALGMQLSQPAPIFVCPSIQGKSCFGHTACCGFTCAHPAVSVWLFAQALADQCLASKISPKSHTGSRCKGCLHQLQSSMPQTFVCPPVFMYRTCIARLLALLVCISTSIQEHRCPPHNQGYLCT